MGRKGENIYKRKDKRWEGRYIVSYNTEGKAVYKSVYGKSYTEVRLKMRNYRESRKSKPTSISLVSWVENYLKTKEGKIKITTVKVYERYLNNYIKPFFGNTALGKTSKEMLQSFVNSLSERSSSTVKGIFSFLTGALKKAEKDKYISPIWLDIELPKAKKREVKVFTREEQQKIERCLNLGDNPNNVGILLCLYTGLRIGELCGLKWDDIDFDTGNLFVNRTVQRITVNGRSVLRELPPKSEASCRKIPIPSFILDKLKIVKKISTSKYIISTNNHITDPRIFQYHYKKLLEYAGVRYANPHTMRHTFSVRALELGFDVKTLSEILGHADASVTLKIYAHSLDEHKRNSMEKFSAMIR